MALTLFKEKRLAARKSLTGLLPGRLTTVDGTDIACQPKDVSAHGLGITSDAQLQTGTIVVLKLKHSSVVLEVAWIQPGFGKRDEARFGLVTKDSTIDLEKIFLDAGCLK